MGQQKNTKLKAFVRFDGTGRVIAGSLILQKSKPKVGNWQEIDATQCCGYVPTPSTTTTTTAAPTTTTTTSVAPTTTTTTTAAPIVIQLGLDSVGACNNWGHVNGTWDGSTFCNSITITSTSLPFSEIFGPPSSHATFFASYGGQVREFTNPPAGQYTATAIGSCAAC